LKANGWNETTELVGIFSILGSLIFVALQLQQEKIITLTEMRSAIVANSIAVNDAIINKDFLHFLSPSIRILMMTCPLLLRMFSPTNPGDS